MLLLVQEVPACVGVTEVNAALNLATVIVIAYATRGLRAALAEIRGTQVRDDA